MTLMLPLDLLFFYINKYHDPDGPAILAYPAAAELAELAESAK